jgi:hypothetical protein
LVDGRRRREDEDEPGAEALTGRMMPDEAEPRREKTGAWLAKGLSGSMAGDGELALGPEGVALVAEWSESIELELWRREPAEGRIGGSSEREANDGWRIVPLSGIAAGGGGEWVTLDVEGGSSHIDRCLGRVGAATSEPEADFIESAEDLTEDASSDVCAGAVDLRRSVKRLALGVASSPHPPAALEPSVPTEEKLPLRLGLLGGLSSGLGALLEPEEKTPPSPSPKPLFLRLVLLLPLTLPALIELVRLRSTSNEWPSDSDDGGGESRFGSVGSSSSSSTTDWMSGERRRVGPPVGGGASDEADGASSDMRGIDLVLRSAGRSPPLIVDGPAVEDEDGPAANGDVVRKRPCAAAASAW